MVATRSGRGAAKATESAAAANHTLKAPPKRAGKRKAVEEAPAEPEPKIMKTKGELKKTTAPKTATKTAPKTATKAASKTATKAALQTTTKAAPKPATRTTRRAAKAVDPAEEVEQPAEAEIEPAEMEVDKEAKPARRIIRGRKPSTKLNASKNVDAPVIPDEPVTEAVEPAPEPVPEPVTKVVTIPTKATTRVRNQLALKTSSIASAAPAPIAATRVTRGRRAAVAPPVASPLKAPARKPAKKATKAMITKKTADRDLATVAEEPFAEYPNYPSTPGHIAAPLSNRTALGELPANYPSTPAHIAAPISNKDAIAELPGYPKTPAHISAALANQKLLDELPEEHPETPAHITTPLTNLDASEKKSVEGSRTAAHIDETTEDLAAAEDCKTAGNHEAFNELPDYPKTPVHIAEAVNNKNALNELPDYPKTPAHIAEAMENVNALNEMPEYPKTPAHIAETIENQKALNEMPEYPTTPRHVAEAYSNQQALDEMPEYPKTPAHVAEAYSNQKAFGELAVEYPKTPAHVEASLHNQRALNELPTEYPRTPAHVAATLANQEALSQLPDYPKTPAHIAAPLSSLDGLKELPAGYPQTPAHINAPLSIQEGLAALPRLINTPMAPTATAQGKSSSPVEDTDFEPSDMSYELTGPLVEFQPPVSLPEEDEQASASQNDATDGAEVSATLNNTVLFALPQPTLQAPPASPGKRSALRSPLKNTLKTPKKTVTWQTESSSPERIEHDFLLYGGPLRGTRFFVDVTSNGKDQSFLFTGLLEDMGAKVERTWTEDSKLSHVLFKDGNKSTLEKVVATNGKVACVNVGWVLDSEKNRKRMDEQPYLVDLTVVTKASPPKAKLPPFTPAKTPSKYSASLQEKTLTTQSIPSTPTSSEFDRSINYDDKENSESSFVMEPIIKTCPKPKFSWLYNKSPMKTPSKADYLKQMPMKAFSTTKKRDATQSFGALSMTPLKKPRFI